MSRIFRILFIFSALFTLFLALPAFGNEQTWPGIQEVQEVKDLVNQKKYEEAIRYLQAHGSQNEDPNYFYNLGTLYYQAGQLGMSIAYLEKANRLHPHNPDFIYNLSLARSAFVGKSGSESLDPASSWVEQIADRISLDEVRTTLGFLGICVVAFWSKAYFATRNLKRAILNPAGLLGFFGFIITVGIYSMQRWIAATPPGVCLQKITVQSGPGDRFMELARLEEGTKVRILSTSESQPELWTQIRYSPNGIGWVRASSLLTL